MVSFLTPAGIERGLSTVQAGDVIHACSTSGAKDVLELIGLERRSH